MDDIYLDHAAATPLDKEVLHTMMPFLSDEYANPSALYKSAEKSRLAVENSREKVSEILGCATKDIVFTSCGTESNNLAIFGIAEMYEKKHGCKGHIITTKIEHSSVLEPVSELERRGFAVTYLDVDEDGFVNIEDFGASLREDTILISIGYANNEIGTIQNVKALTESLRTFYVSQSSSLVPSFHTDACQAANYLSLNIKELGVDAMTLNSSKIYGPKGVGALYIKDSVVPRFFGGGQEGGARSGTENVPGIVGFAKALELAQQMREQESERLTKLRDKLIEATLSAIPYSQLNGGHDHRLPNNVNFSFRGIEGEALLIALNDIGIEASAGSSCSSASTEPSHVMVALGLDEEWSHSATRFTLGRGTNEAHIEYVLEKLPVILANLKEDSPF